MHLPGHSTRHDSAVARLAAGLQSLCQWRRVWLVSLLTCQRVVRWSPFSPLKTSEVKTRHTHTHACTQLSPLKGFLWSVGESEVNLSEGRRRRESLIMHTLYKLDSQENVTVIVRMTMIWQSTVLLLALFWNYWIINKNPLIQIQTLSCCVQSQCVACLLMLARTSEQFDHTYKIC